jgi:hypothetical protein
LSSMMSCSSTPTEDVAGIVCMSDPFCCRTAWDGQCVAEASGAFRQSILNEANSIAARSDLTCDQKNQYASQINQEISTHITALPCLGPMYSNGPICESRGGPGHF